MRLRRHAEESRGITKIEILIGIVVLMILVGAAVPVCSKYSGNTSLGEAGGKMNGIITASRIYALENRDAFGDPIWPSSSCGIVDLRPTDLFTYSITGGGGSNADSTPFTITAKGIAGRKMAGTSVTITVPSIQSKSGEPIVTRP